MSNAVKGFRVRCLGNGLTLEIEFGSLPNLEMIASSAEQIGEIIRVASSWTMGDRELRDLLIDRYIDPPHQVPSEVIIQRHGEQPDA